MRIVAVLLLLVASYGAGAVEPAFSGTVAGVSVTEVLTVQVEGSNRPVRLYGIDAPEPGQPFSREALTRVRELALQQTVRVQPRAVDSAGVLVAVVLLADGTALQDRLLEEGLVWWDRHSVPEDRALRRLNAEALLSEAGIWSQPSPVPPWEYRETHQLNRPRYSLEPANPQADAPMPAPVPAADADSPETPEAPLKTFSVTQEMVDQAEEYDLLTLVTLHQPRMVLGAQGETVGITVSNVSELPLATSLGFQEGDILTRVNGVGLMNQAQIFLLVSQFEDVKLFDVEVLRQGTPVRWKIQLP